jgi:hypothetical protein
MQHKQIRLRRRPDDNIFIFDNVITDELCDKIIDVIKKEPKVKDDWNRGNNVVCEYAEVHNLKDENIKLEIDDAIFKVMSAIIKVFALYDIKITSDSGYLLRKITGPTRFHMDSPFSGSPDDDKVRVVSIVIALNDDHEGGEFIFPQQRRKIKLKKGQLIAFPPYWTHPHGTADLRNNTVRYTVTSWLNVAREDCITFN